MKRIIYTLLVSLLVAGFASCTKDTLSNNQIDGPKSGVSFVATLPVDQITTPASKTSYDGVKTVTWEVGDQVKVFDAAGASDVATVTEAGEKFSFTVELGDGPYYAVASRNSAFVTGATISGSTIAVPAPGTESSSFSDCDVLFAKTTANLLTFKHAFGIIEFSTADASIDSIDFIFKENAVGGASINLSAAPAISLVGGSKTVRIKSGFPVSSEKKFYLAAVPGSYTGFIMTLYKNDMSTKTITADVAFDLTAGGVKVLGNIDSRVAKTYKYASISGFSTIEGDFGSNLFHYKASKGDGTNEPAINTNAIRIYKPANGKTTGGVLEISANENDKIVAVKVYNKGKISAISYSSNGSSLSESITVANPDSVLISGLSTDKVSIFNTGSEFVGITKIEVTYEYDSRQTQSVSFPQESYSTYMGTSFSAPSLSGAQGTVTYSSSNEGVATVNSGTGAVALVGAGTTKITATVAGTENYKPAKASYTLTVSAIVSSIAAIKAIYSDTAVPFIANLSGVNVTIVDGNNAYIQDANDGILVYTNNHGLAQGDQISGSISGNITKYNGTYQINNIVTSSEIITHGSQIAPASVDIATLESNFASYESKFIKVSGLTVSEINGKNISVSENANIVVFNKNSVAITVGTVFDAKGVAAYYGTTKEITIFSLDDADVTTYGSYIKANDATVAVGDTVAIGETTNNTSGARTYSSGNESVAKVTADGKIVGVAAGETTVTCNVAASGKYSATSKTVKVTVSATKSTTETLVIADYATDHSWQDAKAYNSASTTNVNFTASGTGNNCKYYKTDQSWRFYSTGSGTIQITVPSTKKITKIELSGTSYFVAPENWTLTGKVFTPNKGVEVCTVTIANGSGTSKITSIAVTYN